MRHLACQVLQIEATAVHSLQSFIGQDFVQCVQAICRSKGRLVVTGIGKSALVAQKIVATFNSTGTPSLFMHAADAIHGDLGMIQPDDIVLCLSKSGETPEVKVLIPLVKYMGNNIIALVGNIDSYLARHATWTLNAYTEQEACPNNLAPTASTTAQMALGDALAVCVLKMRGFSPQDFAKFHPGGTLGKRLYLRVSDLVATNPKPCVDVEASLRQVIVEISSKRLGAAVVLDHNKQICGIVTDGDLRRALFSHQNEQQQDNNSNNNAEHLFQLSAKDIMSKHPKTIDVQALAVDALQMIRQYKVTQIIATNNNQYAGMLHLHDLVREGIL